ncbi:MAG: DUF3267 domain-containing protein [Solibacillus sp.]|uniref:DUF3267 domain-containing protein n=1 Tax=unclassified Solibacillus TaxID=2637870 RepID=UPI0030F952E5
MDQQPIVVELDMKKIARDNIILTILLVIIFVIMNMLIHQRFQFEFSIWDFMILFTSYLLLIILHEAFHLIGFMLFGKVAYKELDYGVNLKLGVAYATTKKPLSNAAMKKALLLPFWTTGVLPAIVGFSIDNFLLVLLGALLIAGAIGDFYMYKELRKYPEEAVVKDDPKEPKLYIYL